MPILLRHSGRVRSVGVLVLAVLILLVMKRFMPYEEHFLESMNPVCETFNWHARSTKPRVFDCFAFNNNLDVLEMRLTELAPVVDKFIIVESTFNYNGKRKELHYAKNAKRFKRFHDQIVHLTIDTDPIESEDGLSAFVAKQQRMSTVLSAIHSGMQQVQATANDLVIMSKVNEIPRASVIAMLADCQGYSFPVTLEMPGYVYDFGCQETTHALSNLRTYNWRHAKVIPYSMLSTTCESGLFLKSDCIENLRLDQQLRLGLWAWAPLTIINAGWHVSYFMPVPAIVQRFQHEGYLPIPLSASEAHQQETLTKCLILKCKHIGRLPLLTRTLVPPPRGPAGTRSRDGKANSALAWHPEERSLPVNPEILAAC